MARRRSPIPAIALGLLGVVLVLAASLPGKASDADELKVNLQPVFASETADQATTALDAIDSMIDELATEAVPAIGTQLGVPDDQLPAVLPSEFPATARALESGPEATERLRGLVSLLDANRAHFDDVQPVNFTRTIWLLLVSSAVAAAAGAAALVASQRASES